MAQNTRICHPSYFRFQIRDSRAISQGDFCTILYPFFHTKCGENFATFFSHDILLLAPENLCRRNAFLWHSISFLDEI